MTGNVFNVVARIEQCVALVAKEEQEDYCSVPALIFYRQMPDDLLKINEDLILKVFNLFIQLDGFFTNTLSFNKAFKLLYNEKFESEFRIAKIINTIAIDYNIFILNDSQLYEVHDQDNKYFYIQFKEKDHLFSLSRNDLSVENRIKTLFTKHTVFSEEEARQIFQFKYNKKLDTAVFQTLISAEFFVIVNEQSSHVIKWKRNNSEPFNESIDSIDMFLKNK